MLITDRLTAKVARAWFGRVNVWHHPSYRIPIAGLEATTGFDPKRADAVLTWLLDVGLVIEEDVRVPTECPWRWIAEVHEPDYLGSLDRPEVIARIFAADPARIDTAAVIEHWRYAVGGTVAAAREVVAAGGRAANLLGGFHHAGPAMGGGFCGVNDVAVAVRRLRRDGFRGRITILDLDAHPPDGLALCLLDDLRVDILSIGVESAWAVPSNVREWRVPRGSGDDVYLPTLDRLLADVPKADLAFVIAGADPLAGDRLGALACSEDGLRERDRRVLAALDGTPTVLLPAGGYTAGAWRVFAGTISLASGFQRTIRPDYDPVLRRSVQVSRSLEPSALSGDTEEAWITEADLDSLHVRAPERFLGYYTRQGLEYALSRHGLLDALRRMGFRDVAVEMNVASTPHNLRVSAVVNGQREALIEVTASRKDIEGFPTLFVDWLSLRDPRARFEGRRQQLPGQESPGLGLLNDVLQLLCRMAERLHLAGLAAVPSHFHIAAMAHPRFRFVDPEMQGRFLALREVTSGLSLGDASRRLDGPGWPVEMGDPVRWTPAPFVLPMSPGLAAALDAKAPDAERARERWKDQLLPV